MVLGILTAIAACPAIIGTVEAVQQGQKQNAKERHRGRKSNMTVHVSGTTPLAKEIEGCAIVLADNKLWLSVPTEEFPNGQPDDHPFAGYFLPYPDRDWKRLGEGYVSTICDDPPQLNWIYVDIDTCEVKYGDRAASEPHLVGPWTVTPQDRRVTLDGWEGFIAVKYGPGEWALYFDIDDNGLKGVIDPSIERLEVVLERREMKVRKPREEEEEEPGPGSEPATEQATEGTEQAADHDAHDDGGEKKGA